MADTGYTLVLGDRNYSSWSIRPWLLMRMFDIPFEEIDVDIYNPGARARILEYVPSGKVPALKVNGLTIWDTAAIIEYLAESRADLAIWPRDKEARAVARAVSAEMHSGFEHLRGEMPMDMNSSKPMKSVSKEVGHDITRIVEFLFGDFSAADAMYAPVTSRFRTYKVNLADFGDDGTCTAYCETILALPPIIEWMKRGRTQMEERGAAY